MKVRFLLMALVVAAVVVTIVFLFPSDERKIRKQFDRLAAVATKPADETLMAAARKIQGIKDLFDETIAFETHVPELSGTLTPEDVSAFAARARRYFTEIVLEFHDLKIGFPHDGTATVTITSLVTARGRDDLQIAETHELDCILKKREGTWVISSITVVSVLER